jgi:hypothetical protein
MRILQGLILVTRPKTSHRERSARIQDSPAMEDRAQGAYAHNQQAYRREVPLYLFNVQPGLLQGRLRACTESDFWRGHSGRSLAGINGGAQPKGGQAHQGQFSDQSLNLSYSPYFRSTASP